MSTKTVNIDPVLTALHTLTVTRLSSQPVTVFTTNPRPMKESQKQEEHGLKTEERTGPTLNT